MERRTYLSALALALAGCTRTEGSGARGERGFWFWLLMDTVTDAEIARRQYPKADRQIIQQAITEGSATDTTTRPPLFEPGFTYRVRYDGTVYAVSSQLVEDRGVTDYVYTVELDPVEGQVRESEVNSYGDLPAVDREELAAEGFESVASDSGLGYGFQLEYSPDERSRSVLVPTPRNTVIEWESCVRGRFRVVNSRQQHTKTYRYRATALDSVPEVGNQLLTEHAFTLGELSDAQHEIVQKAIENPKGYMVDREDDEAEYAPDPAVRGLYDLFASHAGKRVNDSDKFAGEVHFLVKYRSEVYWVTLRFVTEAFQPNEEEELPDRF